MPPPLVHPEDPYPTGALWPEAKAEQPKAEWPRSGIESFEFVEGAERGGNRIHGRRKRGERGRS
jgi:hypothetical protein